LTQELLYILSEMGRYMAKPKKTPYYRTDAAKANAGRWRRELADVRRTRMFQLLGGACVGCGSNDQFVVRVRKAVDVPFLRVSQLWHISTMAFEEFIASPQARTDYMLICNPCMSKRIMLSHAHGTAQRSRHCKCAECTKRNNDRVILFRQRARLRKLRATMLEVERDIARREREIEMEKERQVEHVLV
jgi:hypothetical protein